MAAVIAVESSRETKDAIALVVSTLASWGLFGFGLIAPLTPSEGLPTVSAVLLFFALPAALFALVAFTTKAIMRWAAAIQLFLLVVSGGWLLQVLL